MPCSHRIGLIVPSSNTTMETEIPELLRRRSEGSEERFTFHSSRMRMQEVNPEELVKMDDDSLRCAVELSDARCDVLAYACLVAIMSREPGYHLAAERRIAEAAADNGGPAPVVSSAGALVAALEAVGAQRVALITPYAKPLTAAVARYIQACGIPVADTVSLEVTNNLEVGRLDPAGLPEHVGELDLTGVDALVLSACVQMPSLPVIQLVEDAVGIPVLSAATATPPAIMLALGMDPGSYTQHTLPTTPKG
jgi:maleate isomerase